jgi:hypothetical protein
MRRAACALGIAASLVTGCRVCPPKVTHVGAPCGGPSCDEPSSAPTAIEPIMPVEEHPVPFEVAPWLAGGGAMRFAAGQHHLRPSFGTGVEGTFTLGRPLPENCLENRTCERPPLRLGPWLGVDSTLDRTRGEGGIAFDLGGPREISWSTFGLRLGAGYATSRVADVVGQLSWGTRFVRWRRRDVYEGGPCPAVVAPVSGLRLVIAARRELDGPRGFEVAVGIEWRPFTRGAGLVPHDFVWR